MRVTGKKYIADAVRSGLIKNIRLILRGNPLSQPFFV